MNLLPDNGNIWTNKILCGDQATCIPLLSLIHFEINFLKVNFCFRWVEFYVNRRDLRRCFSLKTNLVWHYPLSVWCVFVFLMRERGGRNWPPGGRNGKATAENLRRKGGRHNGQVGADVESLLSDTLPLLPRPFLSEDVDQRRLRQRRNKLPAFPVAPWQPTTATSGCCRGGHSF